MYKIKALNKISKSGAETLKNRGYSFSEDEEKPDAVILRSANMHEYEASANLLCVARAGAGVNNIPKERFAEEGIVVFNTPGANAEAVKELAICALLLSSRDILGGTEWLKGLEQKDDRLPSLVEKEKSKFAGPEIKGKVLGVVGLGAIGAKIASAAIELGMEVYGYDPYLSVKSAWNLSSRVKYALTLDIIYKNCDYITMHLPYTEATHHMICKESIEKMKDGVRIINLARGELVCDEDMISALDRGSVSKYVTDFPNKVTVGRKNVIAMPHLGASTPESEENCTAMAVQSVVEYLENGNIINSVNYPNVYAERVGDCRVCVIHSSGKGTLQDILDVLEQHHVSVESITSKPCDSLTYTMADITGTVQEELADEIGRIQGILRVRVL